MGQLNNKIHENRKSTNINESTVCCIKEINLPWLTLVKSEVFVLSSVLLVSFLFRLFLNIFHIWIVRIYQINAQYLIIETQNKTKQNNYICMHVKQNYIFLNLNFNIIQRHFGSHSKRRRINNWSPIMEKHVNVNKTIQSKI